MYNVEFYQAAYGRSELRETLLELKRKSAGDKEARATYLSVLKAIALEEYGTRLGMPQVRHLQGELWELRPKAQRIFFFYWRDDAFVLLHSYVKKS